MDCSLFNHLALPPRLPSGEDPNINEIEDSAIDLLLAGAQLLRGGPSTFASHPDNGQTLQTNKASNDAWESVHRCLEASKLVNRRGQVNKLDLVSRLRCMTATDALVLHIRSQNAALLIHRLHQVLPNNQPEQVVFEVFEASASNKAVLASQNALQWDFPGGAVAIPLATFRDEDFQESLATFLEQASLASTKMFGARTLKAGIDTHEERDAPGPQMISSMLMAVLEENGCRVTMPVLRKRVRDDICWGNASRLPWRRLPYWLVLRVAVERYLSLVLGAELGRFEYKFFICASLAYFLETARMSLEIEEVHFLKAKICRRLVKLDLDKNRVQHQHVLHRVDTLLARLSPRIEQVLEACARRVQSEWEGYKQRYTKVIPTLPKRASSPDMKLPLRISGETLRLMQATSRRWKMEPRESWTAPANFNPSSAINKNLKKFAQPYIDMCKKEEAFEHVDAGQPASSPLSPQIQSYVNDALPLYIGNVGQMSILVLNAMEQWVRLDRDTCHQFPLLRDYHPVFTPEIMDSLHLASFHNMQRLHNIQRYLYERIQASHKSKATVFDGPSTSCFARRFYDESPAAQVMQDLREDIENEAHEFKIRKWHEWQREKTKFEHLTQQVNESVCEVKVDPADPRRREVHASELCSRCQTMKQLDSMWIGIYEEYLPSEDFMAKVTMFELVCPEAFAEYRDTTWMIISRLGSPTVYTGAATKSATKPKCLLRDYPQLSYYSRGRSTFTLGSSVKSFLQTHYSRVRFPVEWEGEGDALCKRNGLKLAYYDTASEIQPGRSRVYPSFSHHLQLELPQNSPFQHILERRDYVSADDGPSSYEIMASQPTCPSGLNPHEFLAFKTLMSGSARRWITILVELGSTNLNWSSEATMALMHHLVVQCGPASDRGDPLRHIHLVFRDVSFVEKLLEQVESRLATLAASANWREGYLMSTMITLLLRIVDLAAAAELDDAIRLRALRAVQKARDICIGWTRVLLAELQTSKDLFTSRQLQQRALATALLCRRTFVIHLGQSTPLDPQSLQQYLESSLAIQENIPAEVETLSQTPLQELVSGLKLAWRLQPLISLSVFEEMGSLHTALKHFWPEADRMELGNWTLKNNEDWIYCDIDVTDTKSHQMVMLNLVFGTLLVNGRPVGNLPQESQNSILVKELFGDQPLRVFQSSLPGMAYTLTQRPCGFTVHVGYDDCQIVIIAKLGEKELRLVPREKFCSGNTWDLPTPLLNECLHWFNLGTGDVYITPVTDPWVMNSWTLNIHSRMCSRIRPDNYQEHVIDPLCRLFRQVGRILEGIAPRGQLLVTQPCLPEAGLQVLIPKMHLMFFVQYKRLYSPQLGLEIDPDQDAGTWYGLRHKLVCRKVDNPMRRTILVPRGRLFVRRSRCHVIVSVNKFDSYCKFDINNTLGRIDCAPEPTFIYTRSLLHAYTSFLLPDPLTGRTGTEESLQWLRSGICRPWTVLGSEVPILAQIASLTPVREYYPPDMKVMKMERWDDDIPHHMQHPLYQQVVNDILSVSRDMSIFAESGTKDRGHHSLPSLPQQSKRHLNSRALTRQRLYERRPADDDNDPTSEATDYLYLPRDGSSTSDAQYAKVMEMTHLLRTRPDKFATPPNLATILSRDNVIGGYGSAYDKVSLDDRLHMNIRGNWGSLVESCRSEHSHYTLMFLFAPLVFRGNVDDGLLESLLAFATIQDLQRLTLPSWSSYFNFRPGAAPEIEGIARLLYPYKLAKPEEDLDGLEHMLSAKLRRKRKSAKKAYEMKAEEDCRYVAGSFVAQWPCREVDLSTIARTDLLVDLGRAMEVISPEWLRLFQNHELSEHLKKAQSIMDAHHSVEEYNPVKTHSSEPMILPCRLRGDGIPSLSLDLLKNPFCLNFAFHTSRSIEWPDWAPLATIPQDNRPLSQRNGNSVAAASNAKPQASPCEKRRYIEELRSIVDELSKSESLVRQSYARGLLQSLEAFQNLRMPQQVGKTFYAMRDYSASKAEVLRAFQSIKASLERQTKDLSAHRIKWLRLGGLWPAITTIVLLQQISSSARPCLGDGMQRELVSFGLAITKFQRDMRLNAAVLAGDTSLFEVEEANIGHRNWQPEEQPDWLLLEIESNLLIRRDQVDVARATIWPRSGTNSVLQMNMGQGKTSCIIPMVAAAMADKKNLVRVIVPKALLQQTGQLLQSRLSGLLNRDICHIPFSRRTPTQKDHIGLYLNIHQRVLKSAGVVLCLPEHNLSFKLSGQQRLLDDKVAEAEPMIRMEAWLQSVCRDILDESDYTLAARTQLIYPSGSQVVVDGNPHRWLAIEAILGLVNRHLYDLASSYPHSIEVIRNHNGGFPLIYFLRQDVQDEMLRQLTLDITEGFGDVLPIHLLAKMERVAVKDFLSPTSHRLQTSTLKMIQTLCPDQPQYGLHPQRDPVAVPFHAKGVPSDQSEWGHPDVAILFTCLAFYYDGINESQLRQALARVLKSGDPSTEYSKWVQSCDDFPESLMEWNAINVEDNFQVHKVWKAVRYQVVVIDYFLNNFVFPRHAKQFKVKLQSSGWDIPLFSPDSSHEKQLTTGFSGTNDNRTMLPLTVKQADLPNLSHTNAEVLTYLLHDRSRECKTITDVRGARGTERDLLFQLWNMNIHILIDAGAQILEMDNETLAKTWLSIDQRCRAALYFDTANKPWVITRINRKTPLLASPYAEDLSECLVYLDEAHTRGTDLKLPLDARGALTVGQGQCKDHTVQAAMRLRQLGTTQSVTFFVPPEVHQVIADLRGKSMHSHIDSYDVICWLLDNSCESIEQLQPLYYSQGIDFCRRTKAALDNPDYLADANQRAKYTATIKQNELQTLREMYEPRPKGAKPAATLRSSHPKVNALAEELSTRRKDFQDTGRAVHGSALQEVEQEREVAFEVETVRQVKKPPLYEALWFTGLHRDLDMFARSGQMPVDSHFICPLFSFLSKTTIGRKHHVSAKGRQSKLFLSGEFQRTVKSCTDLVKDTIVRPVSWVLWSRLKGVAVVLIPEEAEQIIQMIRANSTHPQIHLLSYASPVTKKMLLFNNLTFFSMPALPPKWVAPASLKIELGLLAGRLYFKWNEYETLCKFLDVGTPLAGEDVCLAGDAVEVNANTNTPVPRPPLPSSSFSPRPLVFLQEWLAIRRHGQDFVHTPMGFLTQAKPLQESHPFFAKEMPTANGDGVTPIMAGHSGREYETQKENEEADVFGGVDDMGANVGNDESDGEGEEVVYDESEGSF
ncbi:hypothetical protein B0T25DRAFT_603140 [Lasiosphaeria hispida]|uniref:ubiquitinyl hydrolase 1 n=1 Tax=Lasiosphaeria hispida TaxID=260671 RepID=A0AAJ0MFC9_9PEZI|nr:hypothetical protein B0T25DRAFT_603140 [Lasiosphaeria hispida]